MSVSHLYYGQELTEVSNKNMATCQEGQNPDFKELVKLMALGSKASFSY